MDVLCHLSVLDILVKNASYYKNYSAVLAIPLVVWECNVLMDIYYKGCLMHDQWCSG